MKKLASDISGLTINEFLPINATRQSIKKLDLHKEDILCFWENFYVIYSLGFVVTEFFCYTRLLRTSIFTRGGVESRTQGSRPRSRTQKKSEAKAKDNPSEDRHSRG